MHDSCWFYAVIDRPRWPNRCEKNRRPNQARRKQFRVGPAKIGSSAAGASTLERSGGMLPRKILKFSLFKMHIWRLKRVSRNVFYNEYLPSVADEI